MVIFLPESMFYVPVNSFSVMAGCFSGWKSVRIKCFAKGTQHKDSGEATIEVIYLFLNQNSC